MSVNNVFLSLSMSRFKLAYRYHFPDKLIKPNEENNYWFTSWPEKFRSAYTALGNEIHIDSMKIQLLIAIKEGGTDKAKKLLSETKIDNRFLLYLSYWVRESKQKPNQSTLDLAYACTLKHYTQSNIKFDTKGHCRAHFAACFNQSADAFVHLQRSGEDLACVSGGDTPLNYAIDSASINSVTALLALQKGPDENFPYAIFQAIKKDNLPLLELLLKNKGQNPFCNSPLFAMRHHPLHYAAQEGKLEAVKLLLKYEADVNVIYDKHTALTYALANKKCKGKKLETIQFLLQNGADIKIGEPFLKWVVKKKANLDIIELFLMYSNYQVNCNLF